MCTDSVESVYTRNLDGPFGYGWTLGGGWGQTLAVNSDGAVTVTDADGSQTCNLQRAAAGGYTALPGDYGTLAKIGNGLFTLTEQNGQVTEFQGGQVACIQDADGNRITAAYQDLNGNALVGTAFDVPRQPDRFFRAPGSTALAIPRAGSR